MRLDVFQQLAGDAPPAQRALHVHAPQFGRLFVQRPVRGHADDADLTIFDCLQPSEDELLEARRNGKVVVLEDESNESRRYADLLVNALLDSDDSLSLGRFDIKLRVEVCSIF